MISLRDYFAATLEVPLEKDGCISQDMALQLMEDPPPDWDDDRVNAYKWWATAEARFRYLRADAMMKERERNRLQV
jgi:hypothetical protein